MKAAQINAYGGKDVLKTVDTAPKPSITADQVLVEVHAAAVNPFDWKVREGYMQNMIPLTFPATLGGDVAGVVAEIGEDVSGVAVGDEVYGNANAVSGNGSYAEFTPVKASSLGPKPQSVDFQTAAALPLASVSAYQALVDHIGLKEGQKILIQGGAGGIGSFAIQIAKHIGAEVAATAATEDVEFVKSLGVDTVIDYKTQDFTTILKDYDAVFDTVGGDSYTKSYGVLKDGGIIVSMSEQPNEELAKEHNITALAQQSQVTTERLAKIAELVDEGIIKVNVDKVFPLDEAAEALAYIQDGKHRGKVVLKVKD
jgi:alcohol dehydrogenase